MTLHHPIETLEDNGRRGYIYHDPHGYLIVVGQDSVYRSTLPQARNALRGLINQ